MKSAPMDSELQALEDRIRQTADFAKRVRAENIDLRQRVATLENENRRLAEKVDVAAVRLETLLKKLPE
jgi:cell division protein ZapB